MNKIKQLLKNNTKEILGVIFLILIFIGIAGVKKYDELKKSISDTSLIQNQIESNVTVAKIQSAKIIKTVDNKPLVTPKCSPAEINYTLKNTDKLLQNRNWLVLDLDTFKKVKTLTKFGKKYEYYQRFGKDDLYITIAKKIKE